MSDRLSEMMESYHSHVGRVAVAWAYVELHLNMLIWEFSNVEQAVGACMTSQMANSTARMRALIALVELKGGSKEDIRRLTKLSEKIDKLGRQRHRFVHDAAATGPDGKFVRFELTADKKLKFSAETAELRAMEDLAYKIREVVQELWDVFVRIRSTTDTLDFDRYEASAGFHLKRPPDRPTADEV